LGRLELRRVLSCARRKILVDWQSVTFACTSPGSFERYTSWEGPREFGWSR